MLRFKTIAQFSLESGYSKEAIRGKIRDGIWVEGRVWKKAPDGDSVPSWSMLQLPVMT